MWFIIEANWVQAWLAFVHQNKRSPAPGPVHNEKLMRQVADQESPTATNGWEIIPGLKCAGKEEGHGPLPSRGQTRVEAFTGELYPHSGPAIWTDAEPCEDTRQWQFDASSPMRDAEQTRERGLSARVPGAACGSRRGRWGSYRPCQRGSSRPPGLGLAALSFIVRATKARRVSLPPFRGRRRAGGAPSKSMRHA